MKKLVSILFAAVAMVGCTKDADVDGGSTTIPESFTVAELTRAVTLKDSWAEGDKIAIFESADLLASKCYYVADLTTRELKPADTTDQFFAVTTNKYMGFSPYYEGWSYYDYKEAIEQNFNEIDIISSGDFIQSTALTFSHSQSFLTFDFIAGAEVSAGIESIEASLIIGDDKSVLDVVVADDKLSATASIFVAPLSADSYSTTTKMLHIVVSSGGTPIYNIVDLGTSPDIVSWDVNTPYRYSDLVIVQPDIEYANGTYEIYTAKGLRAFADLVNGAGSNTSGAAISGGGTYFDFSVTNLEINGKVMNDIDLSGVCGSSISTNWSMIGTYYDRYTGIFDGGGYTISNLYINNDTDYNLGLFGVVTGATLQNITFAGVDITCLSNVGSVVGTIMGGTINNCHVVSGSLTSSESSCIGGIVGITDENDTTIINCSNSASLTSVLSAGGIVGMCAINTTTIANCYNSGSVTIATDSELPMGGGIIGSNSVATTTITSCYNSGTISSPSNIGGILSSIYGGSVTLDHCYCVDPLVGYTINATDYTTTNSETMTADEMQAVGFVTTLNTGASAISGAFGWVAGSGTYLYPVLDSTKTPQADGSVQ